MKKKRYYDLNTHFQALFGERVHKITVDAGLSCPNRDGTLSSAGCLFCNARGSGTGALAKGLSITTQLENGKIAIHKRYKAKKVIAYFQSFSNTYAPLQKLERLYSEALAVEDVVGLSIGTRPDCVGSEVLDLLQGFAQDHLIWIEYGLQSVHDATLSRINRGHDFRSFERAVEQTRDRGIRICAHVILGLPGESRDHMLQTAENLAGMALDGIKLHLLYVSKGTGLETLYREGHYRCLEQQEYVELVCDFLERIPAGMVIQRLTGDPHPHELVAPAWSLQKSQIIAEIKETLAQRDTWQGKFAAGSTDPVGRNLTGSAKSAGDDRDITRLPITNSPYKS